MRLGGLFMLALIQKFLHSSSQLHKSNLICPVWLCREITRSQKMIEVAFRRIRD